MTRIRPESGQIRPGDEEGQSAALKDLRGLDVSATNNGVFSIFQSNSQVRPESGQRWPGPTKSSIFVSRSPAKSAQKESTKRLVA